MPDKNSANNITPAAEATQITMTATPKTASDDKDKDTDALAASATPRRSPRLADRAKRALEDSEMTDHQLIERSKTRSSTRRRNSSHSFQNRGKKTDKARKVAKPAKAAQPPVLAGSSAKRLRSNTSGKTARPATQQPAASKKAPAALLASPAALPATPLATLSLAPAPASASQVQPDPLAVAESRIAGLQLASAAQQLEIQSKDEYIAYLEAKADALSAANAELAAVAHEAAGANGAAGAQYAALAELYAQLSQAHAALAAHNGGLHAGLELANRCIRKTREMSRRRAAGGAWVQEGEGWIAPGERWTVHRGVVVQQEVLAAVLLEEEVSRRR